MIMEAEAAMPHDKKFNDLFSSDSEEIAPPPTAPEVDNNPRKITQSQTRDNIDLQRSRRGPPPPPAGHGPAAGGAPDLNSHNQKPMAPPRRRSRSRSRSPVRRQHSRRDRDRRRSRSPKRRPSIVSHSYGHRRGDTRGDARDGRPSA